MYVLPHWEDIYAWDAEPLSSFKWHVILEILVQRFYESEHKFKLCKFSLLGNFHMNISQVCPALKKNRSSRDWTF